MTDVAKRSSGTANLKRPGWQQIEFTWPNRSIRRKFRGRGRYFDAHDPPPGLPREMRHKGLLVRFAARRRPMPTRSSEELSGEDTVRRGDVTVVSSDHRIPVVREPHGGVYGPTRLVIINHG